MSTPTNALIDMPTPSNPCPSTHMDMPMPTPTPTSVPMDTFTPTLTPTSTPTAASTPTLTPTSEPMDLPTPTPAPPSALMGTFTLMPTPTSEPMGMPTPTPTPTIASMGTSTPIPAPISAPVGMAKPKPSAKPSASRSTLPWGHLDVSSDNEVWGSDGQFSDESSHLFSLYLAYADKHDKERAENWIAGADGTLVFTGLFAAALATFVIDSYKSLLPDSGSNAVAVLTQISQQIANGSQISAQAASVPPFQPPTSAIWVNALWFLSLVISLFCALLATLQQYWARRYLRITQTQCAIHKRARLRAFFAEGVERFQLPFAVETIPTLIHISMFLFLAGLVISLFSIHHTIARIILVATVVCGFVYTVMTVMPVFYHNSPYQTPLSALTWAVPRKIARIVLSAVWHIVSFQKRTGLMQAGNITALTERISECKKRLSRTMAKVAEAAAEVQDWRIDARALSWTLDQSDEESELEKFVAGLSRFARSKRVKNPMELLKEAIGGSELHRSLYREVTDLLLHAADPGLLRGSKPLPASVKKRRIEICLEAIFFIPQNIEKILRRISKNLDDNKVKRAFVSVLESELAWSMALRFSVPWKTYRHMNKTLESVILGARCMATVIATQLPDTRSILTKQFGIEDPAILERYTRSRDCFLLKNLNHFIANTVLDSESQSGFIYVEDTDILISTVHIIIQGLRFDYAARELRVELKDHYTNIQNVFYKGKSLVARENAKQLLLELKSLRPRAPGNGSAPTPTAQTAFPIATPNNPTPSVIQSPSPRASSPPPGDVYISMSPYSGTPSGETHPLMPMPTPTPTPSNLTHPEPPPSATHPTMPIPFRDTSPGEESV